MKSFFITATDTDAGKTFFARSLVTALTKKSHQVAVYKPISAGCTFESNQWVNEDAAFLLAACNMPLTLTQVNPIVFEPAIAPHIAAQLSDQAINLDQIEKGYDDLCELTPDFLITEGAGGWRLPLGEGQFLSEFVKKTQQSVILVVNMKLGCLNHAILTYQAIIQDGLECAGWVANAFDNMPYLDENIAELASLFPMPLLAQLGNESTVENASQKIDLMMLT